MKFNNVILSWILLLVYIVTALSFVGDKRGKVPCNKVNVNITDSLLNGFIIEDDIKQEIHQDEMNVLGNALRNINTEKLENLLSENPYVKKSEVYVNINGELCVDIDQRNPILRVENKKGQGYYVDKDGYIMPLSNKYASHVLIANGYIVEHVEIGRDSWVDCGLNEASNGKNLVLCDLYSLAKFIANDKFWQSQIEQIYVTEENEFELIPRVGAHLIKFGTIENYRDKFRNLYAFYHQGLSKKGWNTYEIINLKFENQVICTKR